MPSTCDQVSVGCVVLGLMRESGAKSAGPDELVSVLQHVWARAIAVRSVSCMPSTCVSGEGPLFLMTPTSGSGDESFSEGEEQGLSSPRLGELPNSGHAPTHLFICCGGPSPSGSKLLYGQVEA